MIGGAPPAFVAEVEKKADESVRAAGALYLDGTSYRGENPKSRTADVPGGMFEYLTVVRHEQIHVVQVTYFHAAVRSPALAVLTPHSQAGCRLGRHLVMGVGRSPGAGGRHEKVTA